MNTLTPAAPAAVASTDHAAVMQALNEANNALAATGDPVGFFVQWNDEGQYTITRDVAPYPNSYTARGIARLLRLISRHLTSF